MPSEVPPGKETPEADIKILKADPSNITEQELREFAGNLSLQSFEPTEPCSKKKLASLMEALIASNQPVQTIAGSAHREINKLLKLFRQEDIEKASQIKDGSGDSLKQNFENDLAAMKKLMDQQQLFVLKVGGKSASILGYRKAKTSMPDGREAYEIKKASTLKAYAEKGYYRRLANDVLEEIRKKYPDAVIARATKSKTVKKYCRSLPGWESAGLISSDHPVAKVAAHGTSQHYIDFMAKEGYEVFFFDPQKVSID